MKKGLLVVLATLVTIALTLVSCSNDENLDFPENQNTDGAIEFRTLMDKSAPGLRAAITDEDNILSFTVTGIKMSGGSPVADAPYLFNGFGITRGEDSSWDYTPKRYWPKGLTVDFYAYSPSSSRNLTTGITDYVAGKSITYTVPQIDKKNNQEDFLVAKTTGTAEDASNSAVRLNFHHALSRATFYAKTTNTDVTYVVESVKLLNLNETADLELSTADLPATGGLNYAASPLVQWKSHSSMVNYTADMSEAPTYLGSEFKSMIGATNAILVMPQTTKLSTNGTGKTAPKIGEFAIKVSYKAFVGDIYYAGGPSKSAVKYFAVEDVNKTADKGITFEMGRQYNFYLTFGDEIGGAIGFSVSVSDWTENASTYVPELADYSSLISADLLKVTSLSAPVTKAKLLAVKTISIASKDKFDFTGLEYFENLVELSLTDVKGDADLDASKNAKLTTAKFYGSSVLGTVNLSNTALKELLSGTPVIENLDVSNTKITKYGSSTDGEIKLAGIKVTGTLNMSNCGLTEITTMPTTAPKELNLSNNALTEFTIPDGYGDASAKLNLSNNNISKLTVPAKTSSFTLAELDLSNNSFKTLSFNHSKVTTLNVSNNKTLTDLNFDADSHTTAANTVIETVNAAGNAALKNIKFTSGSGKFNTKISTFDIRGSKDIEKVDVRFSTIVKLIVWAGCKKADIDDKLSRADEGNGVKGEITGVYAADNLTTSITSRP